MATLQRLVCQFGLWIARMSGWTPPPPPCARPHLPDDPQVELARVCVREVQRALPEAPGPVKAREGLRMLQNHFPQGKTRDLNYLLELALQFEARA